MKYTSLWFAFHAIVLGIVLGSIGVIPYFVVIFDYDLQRGLNPIMLSYGFVVGAVLGLLNGTLGLESLRKLLWESDRWQQPRIVFLVAAVRTTALYGIIVATLVATMFSFSPILGLLLGIPATVVAIIGAAIASQISATIFDVEDIVDERRERKNDEI
jgi:hypothetical protein